MSNEDEKSAINEILESFDSENLEEIVKIYYSV